MPEPLTSKKGLAVALDVDNGGAKGNPPKVKEKRRNNEKRKEKSRDAARCRRSRETEIFTDLANVLPARREEVDQLDKASIMRLAIAFLKVRGMLECFPKLLLNEDEAPLTAKTEFPMDDDNMLVQALDGFLLVISHDGDVTYVSENVSEFLGIQQIDMIGQQVWEYSHQCDHSELRDLLQGRRGKEPIDEEQLNMHRDLLVRFKCTLTSRGRSVNIKSASYKVIQIAGHLVVDEATGQRQLLAVGRPLPHPSNIEIPLDSGTFLTKHSLDMRFSYVDDKMQHILGYEPEDLHEKSLYEYHHSGDSESLMSSFKNVITKGQAETYRYRFLAKTGGYCWVVTQATVVYDKQKPQSVVCVNYVISGIEHKHEIYSCAQLEANNCEKSNISHQLKSVQPSTPTPPPTTAAEKPRIVLEPTVKSEPEIILTPPHTPPATEPNPSQLCSATAAVGRREKCIKIPPAVATVHPIKEHRPRSVTASVFSPVSSDVTPVLVALQLQLQSAPPSRATPYPVSATKSTNNPSAAQSAGARSKEAIRSNGPAMNKGFMMYLDDGTDIGMLKEEPSDLAHLAPTPGDACIPLDESAPLFGEMFDGLMLPDGYGTLLPDDIHQLDRHQSASPTSTSASSPVAKHHPVDPFMNYREESCDTIGTPNMLSPGGYAKSPDGSSIPSLCSPNSLSQDDEFAFMTMNCDDGIDLTMRAPYIPMNENDDLPLLTEDLMWNAFSDDLSLHKDIKDAIHAEHAIRDTTSMYTNAMPSTPASATSMVMTVLHTTHPQIQMQLQQQLQCDAPSKSGQFDFRSNKIGWSDGKATIDGSLETGDNVADGSQPAIGGRGCGMDQDDEAILGTPVEDVMDHIYQKNSTNQDAWTMNDLLQLHSHQQHLPSHHTNIGQTIDNDKMMQTINPLQMHTSPKPTLLVADKKSDRPICIKRSLVSATSAGDPMTIQPSCPKKIRSLQMTAAIKRDIGSPNNQTPELVKTTSFGQQHTQQTQLLQQLMAPTPQQQRDRDRPKAGGRCDDPAKGESLNWGAETGNSHAQQQHGVETTPQLPPASNSVLKNLLGCVTMKPPETLLNDHHGSFGPTRTSPIDHQTGGKRPLTGTISPDMLSHHCVLDHPDDMDASQMRRSCCDLRQPTPPAEMDIAASMDYCYDDDAIPHLIGADDDDDGGGSCSDGRRTPPDFSNHLAAIRNNTDQWSKTSTQLPYSGVDEPLQTLLREMDSIIDSGDLLLSDNEMPGDLECWTSN